MTIGENTGADKSNCKKILLADVHQRPGFNHRLAIDDGLVEMIRDVGLINPIAVKKRPEGGYFLIAGARRLAACRVLGHTHIEANVLDDETDEEFASWIENEGRKGIRTYEQAIRFRYWRDERGLSVVEIGKRAHITTARVREYLTLLDKLCPELIEVWARGESTSLMLDLARIAQFPKEHQVDKWDMLKDVRARMDATRSKNAVPGADFKLESKNYKQRRKLDSILHLLNVRMKHADLTPREKELVIGTIEWMLIMRSDVPFVTHRMTYENGENGELVEKPAGKRRGPKGANRVTRGREAMLDRDLRHAEMRRVG